MAFRFRASAATSVFPRNIPCVSQNANRTTPSVPIVVAIAAAAYGALHYMTSVPGRPHLGALPPLTPEEAALAQSLKQHIATIAAREHNVAHYDELEKVARYIEATLASFGYAVDRQEFLADGKMVRNIDVTVEPAAWTCASSAENSPLAGS